MYAAIGTDGTREVVWGLGGSASDAEREAREEAAGSDCDADLLRTVEVSDEVAQRIRAGTVATSELGI
jgi:hypothetical protein